MVYSQKFVAALKCQGKILRELSTEEGPVVKLPFGVEYKLLLKNLESRRVLVKVAIDDQGIGKDLIVEPNSEVELERFIEDLDKGDRFRFIQKTQEIVTHRGDRVGDGIVRVEFTFEQEVQSVTRYDYRYECWPIYSRPWIPYPSQPFYPDYANTGELSGEITSSNCSMQSDLSMVQQPDLKEDEGITVRGSESNQQFHYGYIGELESQSHVIILRLKGFQEDGVVVKKPITMKTKLYCPSCGKRFKANCKFCPLCGTKLVV